MLPLQAAGVREVGAQIDYKPFPPGELKEIRNDVSSYTDNPDQHIQTFEWLQSIYDLAWNDVMLLVDNTLTSLETGKAREAGYSYYTAQGKTLRDKLNIPIEAEVIYTKNPN